LSTYRGTLEFRTIVENANGTVLNVQPTLAKFENIFEIRKAICSSIGNGNYTIAEIAKGKRSIL